MQWGSWAAKRPEMANLSLVLPMLVLGYLREQDAETPIIRRLEKLRDEEMMHSIDFFANNPKSQKRESLRNRLFGVPHGEKPIIFKKDKGNFGKKSRESLSDAA